MTDTVIPFRRPRPGPPVITQHELSEAAAFCAAQGPAWRAEEIPDEDVVWLGLVTPRSARHPIHGAPMPAWEIAREADGIVLRDAVTGKARKASTMTGALRIVEEAEKTAW